MKMDDPMIVGMFLGICLGLHYVSALGSYLPVFLVLTILYLLRPRKIR